MRDRAAPAATGGPRAGGGRGSVSGARYLAPGARRPAALATTAQNTSSAGPGRANKKLDTPAGSARDPESDRGSTGLPCAGATWRAVSSEVDLRGLVVRIRSDGEHHRLRPPPGRQAPRVRRRRRGGRRAARAPRRRARGPPLKEGPPDGDDRAPTPPSRSGAARPAAPSPPGPLSPRAGAMRGALRGGAAQPRAVARSAATAPRARPSRCSHGATRDGPRPRHRRRRPRR